ncbi:MAG: ribonuclease HII [Bacteroidota bacterium]|jgi:ribonuclease HII|nr:ribonuclease HII [Bacteroidota bacterium]
MLKPYYKDGNREAGCDEAGRGCLAGPVHAAAVILPKRYRNRELNDSKQLTARQRERLREEIISAAAAWCIASCSNTEIDEMNILRASITAMHRAISGLKVAPLLLLIDGNRFYTYGDIPHHTIVRGDATYLSIAAASVLAKTERDRHMEELDALYPCYGWRHNKGYPTAEHRNAIVQNGPSPYHRMSFNLIDLQGELPFLNE